MKIFAVIAFMAALLSALLSGCYRMQTAEQRCTQAAHTAITGVMTNSMSSYRAATIIDSGCRNVNPNTRKIIIDREWTMVRR